jgi:hypothetical protein
VPSPKPKLKKAANVITDAFLAKLEQKADVTSVGKARVKPTYVNEDAARGMGGRGFMDTLSTVLDTQVDSVVMSNNRVPGAIAQYHHKEGQDWIAMMPAGYTKELELRDASQAMYRSVLAHEMGHALQYEERPDARVGGLPQPFPFYNYNREPGADSISVRLARNLPGMDMKYPQKEVFVEYQPYTSSEYGDKVDSLIATNKPKLQGLDLVYRLLGMKK